MERGDAYPLWEGVCKAWRDLPVTWRSSFSLYIEGRTGYRVCACRPVALTVRASDSKSEGWGFESLLACQENQGFAGFGSEAFFVPVDVLCTSSCRTHFSTYPVIQFYQSQPVTDPPLEGLELRL